MADIARSRAKSSGRKRLGLVASVVTAGALLGAGITGAAAASSPSPAFPPVSSAAVSSAAVSSVAATPMADRSGAVLRRVLAPDFAAGPNTGTRAQKAATAVIGHPAAFAKLPAALQTDLTALKNASATDAAAAAQKVRTTALAGGYGTEAQMVAEHIQDMKSHPKAAGIRQALRSALNGNTAAAQKAAAALIAHPKLFTKLPQSLQTDLTALKNASSADAAAAANQVRDTALSGGYGAQVQKVAQRLASGANSTSNAPATAPAASPSSLS